MRYVELAGTGLRCSALGFGCANLMGRVSRRQSLRALAAAYDRGITIFDTARSYGWGESEAVLGEFAGGRRDRIILITKFGILPPRKRPWHFLKPLARGLLRLASRFRLKTMTAAVRGQIRQRLSSQVQYGQFNVDTARESLHASLKTLRTDFVDVLFLHGPHYDQIADGKLIRYLEEVVLDGKVRWIGVSSDAPNANRIVEAFPAIKLVQLENNLLNPQIDGLHGKERIGVITNRPFGGQSIFDWLARIAIAAPAQAIHWAEQTGIDVRSSEGIGHLLLSYAFAANPAGVVLCGMHQAEHIARNVAWAEAQPPAPDAFRQVIDDIRRAGSQDRKNV